MDTPTTLDPKRKKIINLVPITNEINEGCINVLREALQRAKNGEVHGCAITLAVKDVDSASGRGSIHMTTWAAEYKDTLHAGVTAMQFSMQHELWRNMVPVDRDEIKPDDE